MAPVTQDNPTVSTAPGPVPSTSSPEKKSLLHSLVTRAGRRFASWSIEQRVLAGFGLVFAGIVVISIASYRNTSVLIKNSQLDTRSHELVQLLGSIGEALDEAERGHRRYLVTGDKAYLKGHKAVLEQMPVFSQYLRGLTEGAPDQEARVASLERLISQQLDAEAAAISARQKDGYEGVRSIALSGAAKLELETTHRVIVELETAEQKALRARVVQSAASTRNTIVLLVLGALLQLVLLASVYHLIHHDITERRRAATELRRRGELLQAANKELEAFSYSVSHDLRAPLRHIDGYASLLSKTAGDSLNEKARRYLQTISDSSKQMGQLIDDLLVFSRMGRQEMLRTSVNLDQLVKTVIHDLRHDLQGRTISWTIGPLPEVYGDPAMLRQVFTNLLSNALKFTRQRAGAKIEIGATQRTAGEAEIFVRDNGAGFDMQYANKLFGVFQRLHSHDEFEGTGIGLANVRRIIHRHGGRTRAEGAVDRGATFFFTLPTKRVIG